MATKNLAVSPLIDIQSTAFAVQYENGIWWSMHGDEQGKGPLSIRYLKANLERYQEQRYFEQQDSYWHHHIGFYVGMYHGGVLSPQTGQLRLGVTTLILFDHPQTVCGYHVGREAFFHEPGPAYRYSEHTLIERVQELVVEALHWKEPEGTWNHALGCLLGELSGYLFPETPQELQAWQEEYRKWGIEDVLGASSIESIAMLQEA